MLNQGTIELKVSLYKFLIALLLGGNTGLLGILIRFIWKWYRKYKNAIMVYIEEHEKLVADYVSHHPEEFDPYPNSRAARNKARQQSPHKRPIGVDRPFKDRRSDSPDE